MSAPEKLTLPQARKLVLLSQQLPTVSRKGPAWTATLSAIEHLGYIQIDTISVIQRAHHHTLWNRNPRYQSDQLDRLLADKSVFEYWAHAASYLPMRDFRYSLPRKHALKSGVQDHWYPRDKKLNSYVLDRIRAEGPLMTRDFDDRGPRAKGWGHKPAKQALEYLFMQGDLMVPGRQKFHKVYDLTERVLPGDVGGMPSEDEHARSLIRRFLTANGLAQAEDFSYLRKGVKPAIRRVLNEMLEAGELIQIQVGEGPWYALPEALEMLGKPLARRKAKILSPFDNLVIQRQRMRDLFDYDFLIECYVPAAKRKYGYFCLPILWDGRLVARMDCKAERKSGVLQVHQLHLEASLEKVDAFREALDAALEDFMRFNGCETVNFG